MLLLVGCLGATVAIGAGTALLILPDSLGIKILGGVYILGASAALYVLVKINRNRR